MSLGRLVVGIQPTARQKVHRGSDDPVTGTVDVRFHHNPSNAATAMDELFGPLKVSLIFHGRAKTKIVHHSTNGNTTYRGREHLFKRRIAIHDDSFRFHAKETACFPYSINFPPHAEDTFIPNKWERDERFDARADALLPPTFRNEDSRFTTEWEAFVEYVLAVEVDMPGISNLAIVVPEATNNLLVLYAAPCAPGPPDSVTAPPTYKNDAQEWTARMSLRSAELLPPEKRPTGFRSKSKAFLNPGSAYPTYTFAFTITMPRVIPLNDTTLLTLRIDPQPVQPPRPSISDSAPPPPETPPDIHLISFSLTPVIRTDIRSEVNVMNHHHEGIDRPGKPVWFAHSRSQKLFPSTSTPSTAASASASTSTRLSPNGALTKPAPASRRSLSPSTTTSQPNVNPSNTKLTEATTTTTTTTPWSPSRDPWTRLFSVPSPTHSFPESMGKFLVPSFKSSCIAVGAQWKLNLTFLVAGVEERFERTVGVSILPGEVAGEDAGKSEGVASAEGEGEQLPSYEEVWDAGSGFAGGVGVGVHGSERGVVSGAAGWQKVRVG